MASPATATTAITAVAGTKLCGRIFSVTQASAITISVCSELPKVTKLAMCVGLSLRKIHKLEIFCHCEKFCVQLSSSWVQVEVLPQAKVSGQIKFPNESKLLYNNFYFRWWLWSINSKWFPSFSTKTWALENSLASMASMRLFSAR